MSTRRPFRPSFVSDKVTPGTRHGRELAAQALRAYAEGKRPAVDVDKRRAAARRVRRHGLRRSLSWQARTPRGWRMRLRLVVRYVRQERAIARREALEDVCAARGHVTFLPDVSCRGRGCAECVRCGLVEHDDPRLTGIRRRIAGAP